MLVIEIFLECCSNFSKNKRDRRLGKDKYNCKEKGKSKRDQETAPFVTENSRSSNSLRLIAKTNFVQIVSLNFYYRRLIKELPISVVPCAGFSSIKQLLSEIQIVRTLIDT